MTPRKSSDVNARRATGWLAFTLLVVLLFIAGGCDRLPDTAVDAARRSEVRMEQLAAVTAERETANEQLLNDSAYPFLTQYAERENWSQHFAAARSELDRARAIYGQEVGPLLEANRSEDKDKLIGAVDRVVVVLTQVDAESDAPRRRAGRLIDLSRNGPARVAATATRVDERRVTLSALATEVASTSDDYPEKRDDLQGRLAGLRFALAEADEAVAVSTRERDASETDLAILADSLAKSEAAVQVVEGGAKDLRAKMAELHASYSKILLDMKTTYLVQIGRTSWNEYVDFARETEYLFRAREVDESVIEELDALGDRPIYAGGRFRISQQAVAALGLDLREKLPRGDNAAELWLADSGVRYFHRYLLEENGTQRELDWQEVDESTFEKSEDDLGMEIVAKPYGLYEEEALAAAAPPGMSKVGNPAYGRWEDDGHGRRRWSFFESYLFYHMMFGGRRHYYYYNDWNHWRGGYRGQRAYYGRNPQERQYGTRGSATRSGSRFAGSTFARRGGFNQSTGSLRGAGPRGRGGGPGGGGK